MLKRLGIEVIVIGCLTSLLALPGPVRADLADGLVAYYPFSGNANDESGRGNNGTAYGGATLTTDRMGTANSAYSFDGTGYIKVPDANSLHISGVLTLSAWVNPSNISDYKLVISRSQDYGASTYGFELNYGRPYVVIDGRGNAMGGTTLSVNTWYLITATYDPNEPSMGARVYVNGVLDGESSFSGVIPTTRQDLNIGRQGENGIGMFYGKIDDVRIYERALSASEVMQLVIGTARLTYDVHDGNMTLDTRGSSLNGFIIHSDRGDFTGSASLPPGFLFNDNTDKLIASQFGNTLNGTRDFGDHVAKQDANHLWNANDGQWDLGIWQFTYTVDGLAGVFTGDIELISYLPGDVDLDGDVDAWDIQTILAANSYLNGTGWSWEEGDFNLDGLVNEDDIEMILNHGQYEGGMGPMQIQAAFGVPEPASLSLLALGVLALIRRRRK